MATYPDPRNPGRVIRRTEVERREVYVKKLEDQLLKSHPILVEMVTNCLHNTPETRPTALAVLGTLSPAKKEIENSIGGNLGKSLNVTNVMHMKETKEMNIRINELEVTLVNFFSPVSTLNTILNEPKLFE